MQNKILITLLLLVTLVFTGCSGSASYEFEQNDAGLNAQAEIETQTQSQTEETKNVYYTTSEDNHTTNIELNKELIPKEIGNYVLEDIEAEAEGENVFIMASYTDPYDELSDSALIMIKYTSKEHDETIEDIKTDAKSVSLDDKTLFRVEGMLAFFPENKQFDLIAIGIGTSKSEEVEENNEVLKWAMEEFGVDSKKVEELNLPSYEEYLEEVSALQSESLDVGRQSQEKITTDIEVVQVYAQDTSDGKIDGDSEDTISLIARLGSGSTPVNLDNLKIKIDTTSDSQTLTTVASSGVGLASATNYNISYLSSSGNPKTQNYLSTGDLVEIKFKNLNEIGQGEVATIRLLLDNGAVKPVTITTPNTMSQTTTYLYP